MKKIVYSITTALTILGVILTQNIVPAFAVNSLGGQQLINGTNRLQNQASAAAGKQQADLKGIIQKADALITNRLNSLNKLLSRVQSDTRLSASEKSSLTTDIQTDINGLTALKAKIDADTDATTARTEAKIIFTNYYVYAVFEPKIRILIIINNLQTVTANIQTLVPQIQNLINTFKAQGKDVTQVQAALDDVSTQLQTINTTLSADATTIEGISVSSKDTAQQTFTQVRQDLAQVVRQGFAKIRADFAQMRSLFKDIILNKHAATTPSPSETLTITPSASPSTTP